MKKLISLISAACMASTAMAQAPAFPGAEGHGRYVTGGRGGKIVHVTNLNDKGTGSFRAAVTGSAKKIVVFDVAGVIPLASDLTIGANTTILGQTAPAPGITLRYYTVRPESNCIIRFIRLRRGQEKDINDGADATWQRQKTGIIFDHCSFSWSIDEVASFYDNNNFTMQWCTVAESLTNPGHSKGAHGYGGIWGGKLASFHHNFLAHLMNRGPRFNGARYGWTGYKDNYNYADYQWENTVQAENVDLRNCLMYNAQGTCYGGPGGGQINIVNNYFKAGPSKSLSKTTQNGISVSVSNGKERGNQEVITTVSVANSGNADKNHTELYDMTSRYYINGNTTETTAKAKKKNRDWDGVKYDSGVFTIGGQRYSADKNNLYGNGVEHKKNSAGTACVSIKMDTPAPTGLVTTHTAETAMDKVMKYAGASLYRDVVDERYMEEASTGTATYKGSITKSDGIIDLVADVKGYTEKDFATGQREVGFDSDNDGIPDEWEKLNGLDPDNPDDALDYSLDPKGYYTNLEVYANAIVEDIMKAGNSDARQAVEEYYPAVKNTTAIAATQGDTEVSSISYYSPKGMRIPAPAKGISIRKITLKSGKVITDKVIR